MYTAYEWDESKRISNREVHGVDFLEAEIIMLNINQEIIYPTPEEDALIQAGIDADPDARELTADEIRRMRPASEVIPHIVERHRRPRGKQKAPTKELISIRIDADLATHFRDSGPGWQSRLNDTLRKSVFGA